MRGRFPSLLPLLILGLIATCDVEFIMLDHDLQRALHRFARRRGVPRRELGLILQFPRRYPHRYPYNGVVRHYPRHRNHMHVRFRDENTPLEQLSARALCDPRRPLVQELYRLQTARRLHRRDSVALRPLRF